MESPSPSAPHRPAARRGILRGVVVAGVVVAGLLWWGWPTLTGAAGKQPTVVIVTPELSDQRALFTRSLRERGQRAEVVVAAGGFCATVEVGGRFDASRWVVVADAEPGCDPWAGLVGAERWWWVAPSGAMVTPPTGVNVIDVTWSVGVGGTLRRVCEWWDVCEADGQVTIRGEPGVLTAAGVERIARVVAALR